MPSLQGFVDMVLSRALRAVAAPLRSADVSYGSTTDVTDAAADAVRALCSFATSAGACPLPGSPRAPQLTAQGACLYA